MKVSEVWLREWVNPSLTGAQLAAQLTMAGLEVDGLHPVAGSFTSVIVAKVQHTAPHPQANKLTCCEVDTGHGLVKVVCGASNVRTGLMVAMALPGAHLPGNIQIKESMLRGELSQGMLCSTSELGLEEHSEGIMELAHDAPLGADLREYLALDDKVFDIDLTPNRADCFSIWGVAREVAALNGLDLSPASFKTHEPTIVDELAVHLEAQDACPRYCARKICGINPHAVTPFWMKERLRRSGIRVVHPVVDVTNYVMLELGQPMHAFDAQLIEGQIHVRQAQSEESLVLLDGQAITLSEDVLVIADDKKSLALAGIMGGEASAVHAQTVDVFLESAFFNPLKIAGVARRYGLSSDSSQRFERGVDPTLQRIALERATSLLLEIVGGKLGPVTEVCHAAFLPRDKTILFHPQQVKQLTGVDVSDDDVCLILQRLGMIVSRNAGHWDVKIPSYRFDVSLDVDLVEEVIRLYGYDHIKAQPLVTSVEAGAPNAQGNLASSAATFLSHCGYHETISYSFVDPELQQAIYPDSQVMSLLNPISSELSQMRVGMWPGLLASMIYNAHRQQTAIKLFETGVVFDVDQTGLQERVCLAGLLTGEFGNLNWAEVARPFDFYDMKGDLQSLFAMLHISDVRFCAEAHVALHPGQSARIWVDDVAVGWMGALHPQLVDALDVTGDVFLFELSLAPLVAKQSTTRYHSISKYPQIRRDLSLIVDNNVVASQIEYAVREVVSPELLKSFDVFDVYTGGAIPAGKKSLAISLTLQDDTRTLIDTEINAIIAAIMIKLGDEFAITLRDSL